MNQPFFPPSELILNPDGSVYHLNLKPEHIAETVIVVGDPDRVSKVSRHFDRIDHKVSKREFCTHVGVYKGKPLTVISSGIGTDNVEILMNELDALVNIDLQTRSPKSQYTSLQIIRIGTSGVLQPDIALGGHLATQWAIGLDALLCFYGIELAALAQALAQSVEQALSLPFTPYCSQGAEALLGRVGKEMIVGNTLTCCGFYAPQGRALRMPLRNPNFIEQIRGFSFKQIPDFRLTNFEMETAAYYIFGQTLGHQMLSCNALVANRATNLFHHNPEKCVDELIEKVLANL